MIKKTFFLILTLGTLFMAVTAQQCGEDCAAGDMDGCECPSDCM